MSNQINEEQVYEQPTDSPLEQLPEQAEQQEADVEQAAEQAVQENSQQARFRDLREAKERTARERDDAIRRLQEYEARNGNRQAAADEEEDDLSIDADSLVEGKHLKTVNKKIKQLEKSLQQATTTAIETSLRAKYSDFDEIVSQDNVKLLRDLYPEIASVISSSPDLYSKSVAAYNFIKDKGLGVHKSYDQDREMAQRNASKPRPLISTKNSSPLSRANEFANGPLTQEYKENLYKQMLENASKA